MTSEKSEGGNLIILNQSGGRPHIAFDDKRISFSASWTFQIEPEEIEEYLRKYDKTEPVKRVDNVPGFVFDPESSLEMIRNGVLYHRGAAYNFEPGDFERTIAFLKRICPDYSTPDTPDDDDHEDKAT